MRSFCVNESERNDAKRHFVLKNSLFSILIQPATHFEMNFEQKCTDTLADFDNILQKIERDYKLYRILQLKTECHGNKQNISFNFSFISFGYFKLLFKNFIYVFFLI